MSIREKEYENINIIAGVKNDASFIGRTITEEMVMNLVLVWLKVKRITLIY